MYWRLQLADYPIRRLHILPGTPGQLAASDSRQRVRFYQLDSGAYYNDLEIDLDLLDNDIPEERRQGLDSLKAPNGAYLPFVEFNSSHLYISEDGGLRLIHDLNAGITLEIDDQIIPLEIGRNASVELVALDRELGTIAAFTSDHELLIFQQQIQVASILMEDTNPIYVFVKAGGDQILLIEADQFS
ncbi:MAG TPA: hypothetical protein VJZ27_11335, partial [Aggregatilineales bacterium]|nr:hypothetical protein [Aggregatilineales bacterium]